MLTKRFSQKVTFVTLLSLFLFSICSCDLLSNFSGNENEQTTENTENPPSTLLLKLQGTWKSSYGDFYIFTTSQVTYDDGGYGYGFTKTIIEVTDNYIYLKDLKNEEFTVISYKDLNTSSISLSNAYKVDGKQFETTLDSSKNEFTIENGYFAYYGEYTKQ